MTMMRVFFVSVADEEQFGTLHPSGVGCVDRHFWGSHLPLDSGNFRPHFKVGKRTLLFFSYKKGVIILVSNIKLRKSTQLFYTKEQRTVKKL